MGDGGVAFVDAFRTELAVPSPDVLAVFQELSAAPTIALSKAPMLKSLSQSAIAATSNRIPNVSAL